MAKSKKISMTKCSPSDLPHLKTSILMQGVYLPTYMKWYSIGTYCYWDIKLRARSEGGGNFAN